MEGETESQFLTKLRKRYVDWIVDKVKVLYNATPNMRTLKEQVELFYHIKAFRYTI